jgi:hypothetical protein
MASLQDNDFLSGLCQIGGGRETIVAAPYDNGVILFHGFDLLGRAFLVILCSKSNAFSRNLGKAKIQFDTKDDAHRNSFSLAHISAVYEPQLADLVRISRRQFL